MSAEGHELRNLLLREPRGETTLLGDAISDAQLADRLHELRDLISEIGADSDPRSWTAVDRLEKQAQSGLDDLILNLIERIEGARIDGFQRGLSAQYRAVQNLLREFYGFGYFSPDPEVAK